MGNPFVGEIRMFGGNFAPAGWMFCNGQLLSIAENETLFQLIGTTYGGDGQATFGLPNLQSRLPVHQGTGGGLPTVLLSEQGGVESVTLTTNQIPAHTHTVGCKNATGNSANPVGGVPAINTTALAYGSTPPAQALNAGEISQTGGTQPHSNIQPFLCVSFIISLFGIFPSPN